MKNRRRRRWLAWFAGRSWHWWAIRLTTALGIWLHSPYVRLIGWPGLENVRDTHDAAGLVCAGLALHTVAQRFGCPVNRVSGAVVALACLLGLTRWPGLQMAGVPRTVSSCFRWPIRAYHVHFSAMDTVGTACYRCPMKTLITIAAVALVGYYAFSFLLAMPMFMLVIGACIWLLVALTGVCEN